MKARGGKPRLEAVRIVLVPTGATKTIELIRQKISQKNTRFIPIAFETLED